MRLLFASILLLPSLLTVSLPAAPAPFTATAHARAEAASGFAIQGDAPDWLFLRDDVLHAAHGEFWKADPLLPATKAAIPIITKFRETLQASGVTLILAPVPSKAATYPDKFISGMAPDAVPSAAPFLEELKSTGTEIIDLETLFRAGRDQTTVFCASDSHWSPAGIRLAAQAIAAHLSFKPLSKPGIYETGQPEKFAITGDLTTSPGLKTAPKAEITLTKIGTRKGSGLTPVPAASTSPVILLGDSHTMVFTDGESLGMHTTGAGLRDHLQAQLGFPLIQLSSQNSGGTGARRILQQRLLANPAYLKDVKIIIWVFSLREFTLGKWR